MSNCACAPVCAASRQTPPRKKRISFFIMIEFRCNEKLGLYCYGHTAELLRFGDKPFWPITFEKYGQKPRLLGWVEPESTGREKPSGLALDAQGFQVL